jgi:hypothetical protein
VLNNGWEQEPRGHAQRQHGARPAALAVCLGCSRATQSRLLPWSVPHLQPAVALLVCEAAASCGSALEAVEAAVPDAAACVLQLEAAARGEDVEGLHVSRGGQEAPPNLQEQHTRPS